MTMRNTTYLWVLLFLSLPTITYAQNKALIKGSFQNIPVKEIYLRSAAKAFFYNHFKLSTTTASLKNNQFNLEVELTNPIINYLYIQTDSQYYEHPIFIAPGYSLDLKFDLDNQNNLVVITSGIGAKDNRNLSIKSEMNLSHFTKRKDSLPDALYMFIKEQTQKDSLALSNYIQEHKPSLAFKEAWYINIKYSTLKNYHNFSENWKFSLGESYSRNIAHWEKIKNTLLVRSPLMNEKALRYEAPNYINFIKTFVGRQKEKLWTEAWKDKKSFITEWYGNDYEAGVVAYSEDPENRLQQKIVDRYFTGACREYLYVLIFDKALATSNPINLENIYDEFSSSYRKSKYKNLLDNYLKEVFEKRLMH